MFLSYHPFPELTDTAFEISIESIDQGVLFCCALELYQRSLNAIPRLASAFHGDFTFLNEDKSIHPLNDDLVEMVIKHQLLKSDPNDSLQIVAQNHDVSGILHIDSGTSSPISRLALPVSNTLNAITYVELFSMLDGYLYEMDEDNFDCIHDVIFSLLVKNDDSDNWAEWSDVERDLSSFAELVLLGLSGTGSLVEYIEHFNFRLRVFFDTEPMDKQGNIKALSKLTFDAAEKFIKANICHPRLLVDSLVSYYPDFLSIPLDEDEDTLLEAIVFHFSTNSLIMKLAEELDDNDEELDLLKRITRNLITQKSEDPDELMEYVFDHNENFLHTNVCDCGCESLFIDLFAIAFNFSLLEGALNIGADEGVYVRKEDGGIDLTPDYKDKTAH